MPLKQGIINHYEAKIEISTPHYQIIEGDFVDKISLIWRGFYA
jgi:hypothetical protein